MQTRKNFIGSLDMLDKEQLEESKLDNDNQRDEEKGDETKERQ